MAFILKTAAQFEPDELIGILRDKPDLLHTRIRFLQGPFPIQNLGRLDLLGLDDQGGWVMVKIAEEGNGETLFAALQQVAWVRENAAWVMSLPAYETADPHIMPSVFLLAPRFVGSMADVLWYVQGVSVGLMKYSAFDMGAQKAIHLEPLFAGRSAGVSITAASPVPPVSVPGDAKIVNMSEATTAAPEPENAQEPNLSLLQPLTDEEIAEFLPGHTKDKMA